MPGVAAAVVTTTVVVLECPRRLSSRAAGTPAATSTNTTIASSIPAPIPRSRGSRAATGAGDRTTVSAGETSVVFSGTGQPSGRLEISVTGSTASSLGAPDKVEDQDDQQNDHEDSDQAVTHLFLPVWIWDGCIPRQEGG